MAYALVSAEVIQREGNLVFIWRSNTRLTEIGLAQHETWAKEEVPEKGQSQQCPPPPTHQPHILRKQSGVGKAFDFLFQS